MALGHAQRESTMFYRIKELEALTGLPRSSIYRLAREGRMPKPVKLGLRAAGWRKKDIDDWAASRSA
ncbi:AlpA family phage regulatory protein [Acidithiobacillus ferrivorans]|nr:AlpA family phage regulatory protein [Acidithiobacillus ferrivorans]